MSRMHTKINMATFNILSPNDILEKGMRYLGIYKATAAKAAKTLEFHKHNGSAPEVLADQWFDLLTTTFEYARLVGEERSENGFKNFLMTHFFLWTYPKNSSLLASRFKICRAYAEGQYVWKWVAKIAALKQKKIIWDPRFASRDSEIFIITVDGTDFRICEKKHPQNPVDRQMCSKKFKHAALKYELAISVF